jgi:hypothetical protein
MSSASKPQIYQLFRHTRREDLWCAVPSGQSLPQVLEVQTWDLCALTVSGIERPPGFDEAAAAFSCRLQGFYVFHWGSRTVPRARSRVLEQAVA